ncbi:hypothetical protein T07_6047 [Trichinella nelsoni]|uniref:Uncharacterized protein n=1 Tax=Trichinella nelsoni TaxID=6336 RepID=A0A0V0RLN7_9BILA|nr:hypothetical protein T07_6047 [Trichinella nelsoni]
MLTASDISTLNAKLTLKQYERTKANISASEPAFDATVFRKECKLDMGNTAFFSSAASDVKDRTFMNKWSGVTDGSDIGMRLLGK